MKSKEEVKFTKDAISYENEGKFKDFYKLVSRLGSGSSFLNLRRFWRGLSVQTSQNWRTSRSQGYLQVLAR